MPHNVPTHGRSGHRDRPSPKPPRQEAQSPSITSKIIFGPKVDPKLYSDIAEEAARDVGAGGRASRGRNKPSQLRRFYDELVMLQARVGVDPQRFEQNEPFVQMLKAKVAYAEGREKVDQRFAALLRHVVDEAKDCDSLKKARLFMEAFMAFYKIHGPKE
jgi:CRISPR-associated protein Csm2